MTQPQPISLPSRTRSNVSSSADLALTLLGPSAAMAQLWAQIRRLAPHVRTVLLTGAPDCGQEAVARLLLDLSPGNHRGFLQLTAAKAETRLLRTAGLNSLPTDVFLYLPDIHRFSLAAQDALLRLMRMRRSRPFTVVAASPEDLRSLVDLGRFTPELADTLSSVRLAVPCLKQRQEDIPMLLSHMLSARGLETGRPAPQPTDEFLRAAMQHSWPGNLRELSRTVACLTSGSQHDGLRAADLHGALALQVPVLTAEPVAARLVSLDTVVQEHISAVLRACRGNKLRAAEVLGISRSTLYRMLDAAAAHNTPLSIAS